MQPKEFNFTRDNWRIICRQNGRKILDEAAYSKPAEKVPAIFGSRIIKLTILTT